ncbi:MAG: YHS domain-containing protein [Deltaproteobacteria bacterium]|nr:YHS domain-containing protein [Deltaproteobacteria bacterium]
MSRLIGGIIIGYLIYLVIRKVAQSLGLWPQPPRPVAKTREPDVLVQDPICQTFIPRREALKAEKDGKVYFFCSEGCLKRFRRSGSN